LHVGRPSVCAALKAFVTVEIKGLAKIEASFRACFKLFVFKGLRREKTFEKSLKTLDKIIFEGILYIKVGKRTFKKT